MRGAATSGQDKFRVTFLMRQVVRHYFDHDLDPVGNQLPPILIVPGVHCRLNNISEAGTWVMDEIFQYGDQQIIRKAGDKVDATIMKRWRALRSASPDLFKNIVVMQQPAAWRDDVHLDCTH